MLKQRNEVLIYIVVTALMIVAGCGKSGDSGSPVPTTTVSGSVFAAPVSGGAIVVKNANGNIVAGPVTTAEDGSYAVNVPTSVLAGDLSFESSGGTYADEATGANAIAGTLAAFVSGGSLTNGSVHLDPSSTIVHELVTKHTKTFGEANAVFQSVFGFMPDTSIASQNTPSNGTNEPQRLKALRAAAFSQLTKDLGLSPEKQFALLTAMAQDMADDGKLNGSAGSVEGAPVPEDVLNKLAGSLATCMTDTTRNLTGLTPDKIGSMPLGTVALTPTFRMEFMPMGMMGETAGKSMFKLKVTDRTSKQPVSGLAVKLMPMMHMPTMSHATPVGGIVDNVDGTYTCTVYYLMASGPGMGFWEMKVMIGGSGAMETAVFNPTVSMSMGPDTVRATLKGQNDTIANMGITEKRTYYIFRDSLASGSTATFKLFIAAKESMMSFPAVSVGTILSNPTGTVAAMSVQASTDGGTTWIAANDDTKGHWTLSGLTGLVTGQTGTIYVKLNVNGEDKTTDGNAPSGANSYATFTVKP